jgi:hypothetical protein
MFQIVVTRSLTSLPVLACILSRQDGGAYVHYLNQDKRLDEWVPDAHIRLADAQHQGAQQLHHPAALFPTTSASSIPPATRRKRKREGEEAEHGSVAGNGTGMSVNGTPELEDYEPFLGIEEEIAIMAESLPMTEEEYDILHHKQIGARKNFDQVVFGDWEIRTWLVSPAYHVSLCSFGIGIGHHIPLPR